MKQYLGIDIGGSSFKYGWGNSTEGLGYFSSVPIREKSLPEFKDLMQRILQEADKRLGRCALSGVGIGTPGTIDLQSSKIVGVNPNLPFWVQHDPRELVPKECEFPVKFDNDANLMALAEAYYHKKQDVVGITIGSGIGGGIIKDGKIYHGAHGFAGEFGHVTVVDSGAVCNCGRQGCLESYASVDGIRNRLAEESPHYKDLTLPQLLAIRNADQTVASQIEQGVKLLARAIANIVVLLDPQAVIMGGGGMELGLFGIQELRAETERFLPELNRSHVQILSAVYGNKAGVMGAIKLFE